jgi:hypothetical protein
MRQHKSSDLKHGSKSLIMHLTNGPTMGANRRSTKLTIQIAVCSVAKSEARLRLVDNRVTYPVQ